MAPRLTAASLLTIAALLAAVSGLQAARDRVIQPPPVSASEQAMLYVRSGAVARRMVLSYDALAADIYWMRALQHFGSTKLSADPDKQYDLLYPLLDLTTTLDPDFEIAYRFGAVFLAEQHPGGAGRPDLAITLLEKGRASHPAAWQYPQDIGFVHYWWLRDYEEAASWFRRAAALPGAPPWLEPMAAVSLTEGGNRDSARRLWRQVLDGTDADWLREQARLRLTQLDALDQMAELERVTKAFEQRTGRPPRSWEELVAAGWLRAVPVDPHGFAYQLNQYRGLVTLSPASTLGPLPVAEGRRP